jgi:hypothetical protein
MEKTMYRGGEDLAICTPITLALEPATFLIVICGQNNDIVDCVDISTTVVLNDALEKVQIGAFQPDLPKRVWFNGRLPMT